ncbi:MAG TPA: OB-fold domain-containing protein [Acidimicrobiia bacterium]|nr:OB-fold domain-containing protein [Acidimicrobiia bacterium]
MGKQVPIVDYLVLDEGAPYLVANRCDNCGALYFDRRNACAKCGGRSFSKQRLADDGTVRSFTIVHRAAPGVPTPYVSAIVDLAGGGVVKANLLNVEPDPEHVQFGMKVRLTTTVAGVDDDGTEAIQFGYEPR